MVKPSEIFLLNDRYFLLETYAPNKDAFKKPHKHVFHISILKDLIKNSHKEDENSIREIYIECKTCNFIRIFSLKTKEKIFKEIFLKTFDRKLELAEKSGKVTSWEYDIPLCNSTLLCVAIGHKYERLENYVNKKGHEVFLDLEDDWRGIRLGSIMWHCLICHHRVIEVYPDKKRFLKKREVLECQR